MDGIRVDETLAETDTQLLRMKINSHLKVLSNFKQLREEGKSRAEYIAEIKEYFCNLYGYNTELMEIFFNLFSPHEVCSSHLSALHSLKRWKKRGRRPSGPTRSRPGGKTLLKLSLLGE